MLLVQFIIYGIGAGAVLGLAGIGFNLIFATTKIFDVAIGGTYLIVAYVYYSMVAQQGVSPWLAAPISLVIGAANGLVCYACIYQWIRSSALGGFFMFFLASFGVLTIVQNVLAMIYGSGRVFVADSLLHNGPGRVWRFGDLVAVVVAVLGFIGLSAVLRYTRVGVRFRAMAENPALLRLLGMSSRTYSVLAFALGSLLMAGAAIVNVYMQGVEPADGFILGTFAIAAMIVGGVGSFGGALLGGLVLGLSEGISLYWISAAWQQAIGFSILLVILMVRPKGLLNAT